MKLHFIVAGVNRSGTVFTARLLTSLGIPCGHESIFDNSPDTALRRLIDPNFRYLSYSSTHETYNQHTQIPHWVNANRTVAESSYLVVPHFDWPELSGVPVIHIARNPLKVISSLVGDVRFFREATPSSDWERPAYNMLPRLYEIDNQIERACYYYVEWNEAIEKQKECRPYMFSQVENLPNDAFFNFTHTSARPDMFANKKINHFGKRQKEILLEDIPNGEIKNRFVEKTTEYGYQLKPNRWKKFT